MHHIMKRKRIDTKANCLFFALIALVASACSPVNQANDHLGSMDQSTQTLTTSVSSDQQYLKNFSDQLELMQKHTDNLETELVSDREYLKTITECMKSLSDSLGGIQKMGDSALHLVLETLMKPPTPDPKTPDANDLLPPKS